MYVTARCVVFLQPNFFLISPNAIETEEEDVIVSAIRVALMKSKVAEKEDTPPSLGPTSK